ncbi:MAG TPA: 50S ribosomal protein L24 [Gemmatimonadaceae bacterium]|nr:50S ribosomal protein L24 [Gemmatimonadaceae bacterium]
MRILKHKKTAGSRLTRRHAIAAERVTHPIRKGDTVRIVRGEDKGKEGQVIRVFPKNGRITVKGVNMVKKHQRARRPEEQSGIIEREAPVHHSNVMLLDPKKSVPTRVRRRVDKDGTKERISIKSGDAIPAVR